MVCKKSIFIAVIPVLQILCFSSEVFSQQQYAKNPHVVYEVTNDGDNYLLNYTFKDHYNNYQTYRLVLPFEFTNNEISSFGIPSWLFEPYLDNEYNRQVRGRELTKGLFMLKNNVIEVDKSAVITRYAETFCKPLAGLIVESLEEYERDTRSDRIEMAMRFVQDIPYGIPEFADKKRHFGGVSPPPGVLINGYGDCDSKVLLFVGILIYLIPANEIIFLNQSDHVLSAIQDDPAEGLTFVEFKDRNFLIAETAGPGKRSLGEKGFYFRNKFSIETLSIENPDTFPYRTPVSNYKPFAPDDTIEDNAIVIHNTSEKDFRFQLSYDNNHWKDFILQKNNSGNYFFERDGYVYIRIRENTTGSRVYKIQTGNAYSFRYNPTKKTWEQDFTSKT